MAHPSPRSAPCWRPLPCTRAGPPATTSSRWRTRTASRAADVILDEPVNGLDPEGVLWIRTLLRSLAAEGRTVLVSSHLMTEMALTADHLHELRIRGAEAAHIGTVAAAHGIKLHELTPQTVSLEKAFMDLTQDAADHRSQPPATGNPTHLTGAAA